MIAFFRNKRKFLALLELEIRWIFPWLLVLFILMSIISSSLFYFRTNTLLEEINLKLTQMSISEYLQMYSTVSLFDIFEHSRDWRVPGAHILFLFVFFILLHANALLLWFKDWSGESKRIYLLLSIRQPRILIVASKFLVILLTLFSFYGAVLLNFFIGTIILKQKIPNELIADHLVVDLFAHSYDISYLFPLTLSMFFTRLSYTILIISFLFLVGSWIKSSKSLKLILNIGLTLIILLFYISLQSLSLFNNEQILLNLTTSLFLLLLLNQTLNRFISV